MDFDKPRDAIEFFIFRLESNYTEEEAQDADNTISSLIGEIYEEQIDAIVQKKIPYHLPDFFDLEDNPRLKLSTIERITGIPQRVLEDPPLWGNNKFRDAADFIKLTGDKYIDKGEDGEPHPMYVEAWRSFHVNAPQELKEKMDEYFMHHIMPEGTIQKAKTLIFKNPESNS